MSIDRREFGRIRAILREAGWRLVPTQGQGGVGTHFHAYPPDPTQPPIPLACSGDPMARRAVYANFRRAGIELDKRRLQQRAARKRRAR